jgi:hypothetical protein
MLRARELILAKVEGTYNVDPTPTAASDSILVENPQINLAGRRGERAPIRTSLARVNSPQAGQIVEITFDTEIRGSGAAGTAPELSPLFQACGMTETVVASTSVTYAPTSTPTLHKSITIYYFRDGKRYIVTGCRGTFTGNLATGAVGKLSWSFRGHLVSDTDVALPSPTFDATVSPALISVPFTIGGFSAVISALSFDMGIAVATPDSIASTDGYGEIRLTGRGLTGSFDPEDVLVATHNFLSNWQSNTQLALTTGVIGSAAGNRYRVNMDKVIYQEIGHGDRDGITTRAISFLGVETTADDEWSIIFT